MNAILEQQIIDLLQQMSDHELHKVLHFIEKKLTNALKNGLGTLLHQQFKAAGLVDAGFVLPERSLETE